MQIKYSKAFKKNVFVEINKKKSFQSGDTLVHLIGFGIIDERTKNLRAGNKLYGLQGKAFPDFEIKLMDGTTLSNQDLKGKPSMINFWFAQCAPCIDEMPLLNKLKNQYSDQVNFVAITYENKAAIEKFLTKNPFEYSLSHGSKEFIDSIGVKSYPTNVFLDSQGRIVKVTGGIPYEKNEEGELVISESSEFSTILKDLLDEN
jgi:thiol-disulfide isomerase/thioredoxin